MASTEDGFDRAAVEALLDHRFEDPTLIARALTHRSAVDSDAAANERLEFQGDRVLALVIADMLMNAYPGEAEGALSKRLHALVSGEMLAAIARDIGLGAHIRLGGGEGAASDQRDNPSILADAMEAAIAALYRDGGLEAARGFVERHWRDRLAQAAQPPKDPKSGLQEWAMARGLGLPEYRVIASEGPPHAPVFTIEVAIQGRSPARAQGSSKRMAERLAAERLLQEVTR